MPQNKISVSTILLLWSTIPLSLGTALLLFPDWGYKLFSAGTIEPPLIGYLFLGIGILDIGFAAFLKSRENQHP